MGKRGPKTNDVLGYILRVAYEQHGLSVREVAKEYGVPRETVRRYLKAAGVKLRPAVRICKITCKEG